MPQISQQPYPHNDVIDDVSGALIGIDYPHHEVHEGNFYTSNLLLTSVANNAYTRLRFRTNATTYAHLSITINVEGKAYLKTFSGGTYTGGTGVDANLTQFNRNSASSNISGVTVTYNPTVSVQGTLRGNQALFGGTGPKTIGDSGGTRIESIVRPNLDIIIELQNVAGQAKDHNIILDWYEE